MSVIVRSQGIRQRKQTVRAAATGARTFYWTQVLDSVASQIAWIVAHGGKLYCGGWSKKVFESDTGRTWTQVTSTAGNAYDAISFGGYIYVAGFAGVERSTDGSAWATVLVPPPAALYPVAITAMGSTLYTCTTDALAVIPGRTYSSTNGTVWGDLGDYAPWRQQGHPAMATDGTALFVPVNKATLPAAHALRRSIDGAAWTTVSSAGNMGDVFADGTYYLAVIDQDPYESADGITWTAFAEQPAGTITKINATASGIIRGSSAPALRYRATGWVAEPKRSGIPTAGGRVLYYHKGYCYAGVDDGLLRTKT